MAILPGFTMIGEFHDMNLFDVLRTRLDAAGIEYVVLDEYRAGLRGFLTAGTGFGVRLLVRDDQVPEALELVG